MSQDSKSQFTEEKIWASDGKESVRNDSSNRGQFLDQEDPLEKEMATHTNTLAWIIPWTEELGGPQFMGQHRVGHS